LTAIALGRTSTENCYETVAQKFVHHAAVFTRREAKGQIGVNFAASKGLRANVFHQLSTERFLPVFVPQPRDYGAAGPLRSE